MFPVFPFWFSVAHFCRDVIWNTLVEYVSPLQEKWVEYVVPMLEPIVLNAVFEFNRAKIRYVIYLRLARRTYTAVNMLCIFIEFIFSIFYHGWILFTRNYIENPEQIWITIFTQYDRLDISEVYSDEEKLYSAKYGWPAIKELYNSFNYPVSEKTEIVTMPALLEEFTCKYTCLFTQLHALVKDEDEQAQNSVPDSEEYYIDSIMGEYLLYPHRSHKLMVGKFGENIRIIRNICSSRPFVDLDETHPTQSEVDFLAVEYIARPGADPISIEIPQSHYIVGNELLSRAYIYRYLRYLPTYMSWDFGEDYSIKCIDDGLHEFYLKSGQCIVLREDTYEIMNMDSEIYIASDHDIQIEQPEEEWEKIGESPK
jgi:hypothetical protein